jgi:aldehyde dehydrogenase
MAILERATVYEAPGHPESPVALAPRYENYIGGRFVEPVKGRYVENRTPVTGEPFTEVPRSTPEDVEFALDAAHAARRRWGETSPTERSRVARPQPRR